MDPEDRRVLVFHRPRRADARHGICASFKGRMRDALLNETPFFSVDHARKAGARWVAD